MPLRLSEEEVVTIRVLAEKGQNYCPIARRVEKPEDEDEDEDDGRDGARREYFEDGRRRSVIFDADGDGIAEVWT